MKKTIQEWVDVITPIMEELNQKGFSVSVKFDQIKHDELWDCDLIITEYNPNWNISDTEFIWNSHEIIMFGYSDWKHKLELILGREVEI